MICNRIKLIINENREGGLTDNDEIYTIKIGVFSLHQFTEHFATVGIRFLDGHKKVKDYWDYDRRLMKASEELNGKSPHSYMV